MKRHGALARLLAPLAACAAFGCSSSHHDGNGTAKPLLAAFNASPDMPDTTFLREQEVWSSITYGVATDFRSVDADQYDVNFDALLPGDKTTACAGDVDKDGVKDDNECTLVATQSINVLNDHEYLVALVGHYGNTSIKVYDDMAHVFDTSTDDGDGVDENAEVQSFNWSTTLGTFDLYIEPPGTNLSPQQAKATLAPGDEYNGLVDEGTYVLTLAPVGDPSTPYYTSDDFTIAKQTRVGLAILDATAESTSPVKVSLFRDQSGDLLDRRATTVLRVSQVAPDAGNVDVYAQENYTAPLFANLALGQTSQYAEIDPADLGALELDVTPAGNVGVLLTREQTTLTKGERATSFFVKSPAGTYEGLKTSDTARRIAPYAELKLVNSVPQSVDVYVIPHGNNVYTSSPTQTMSSASIGASQTFDPGSYDIVIARAGSETFLYGPREIDMAGGGLYTIVAVPTADTARADVLLLDDFAN